MEVAVYNSAGEETKKIHLNDAIFGIEPNDHAIYLDAKQRMANARQGTHKTKERGEVKGSRRKIKRQKGTGTARFGDIKNPIFRGGGRIFGPRPRTYDIKLNKKIKNLARKSALSYKAKENGLVVVEDLRVAAPKTKSFLEILNSLKAKDIKTLVVLADNDHNMLLSSRNHSLSQVMVASDINTYDILKAKKLIIAEGAVEKIENLLN